MDIDALHSALLSLTLLSEQIRAARDEVFLAIGGRPSAFAELLKSMERDLCVAKATLAGELGFRVCRCCWPPELLASQVDGLSYCPTSGKALAARAAARNLEHSAAHLPNGSKSRRSARRRPSFI